MDADAYTFGMFAVAVVGIVALVWMILRAFTVMSLAKPPVIQPTILKPVPPEHGYARPPLSMDEESTQTYWPEQEKDEPTRP